MEVTASWAELRGTLLRLLPNHHSMSESSKQPSKQPTEGMGLFSGSDRAEDPVPTDLNEKCVAAVTAALALGAKSLTARCEDLSQSVRITEELLSTNIGI